MENKANQYIETNRALAVRSSHQPILHFTPSLGWMNDPNGLIFFKGEYHLFYQYHPYQTKWHQMYWGHAVSHDLITWQELPIALAPSEVYEDSTEGGCFSGTAIVHEGTLYLFYTAVAKNAAGQLVQKQCVAMSEDGRLFSKYENNPILQNDSLGKENPHFRDPKVWQKDHTFYMLVGVSQDNVGKLVLYRSENLLEWTLMGVAFEEPNAWMLECPDFYELDGKDVLTFSPVGIKGEYSSYLIGRLDYEKGRFQVESRGILDYGVDFYAPQTFLTPEGERYVIGWQNGWEWMYEWNGFGELTENSWCGAMSIPRKVIRKGDRLHALLPKEISQLKAAETVIYDTQTDGYQKSVSTIQKPTLIELSLEAGETPITLVFKDKRTGQTDTFTIEEHLLYHSEGNPLGRKDITLPLSSRSKTLKILLDLYAIEVFDEDEGTVLSVNSFFEGALARDFSFSCSEKGRLKQVVVTELNGKQLIKRSVKG